MHLHTLQRGVRKIRTYLLAMREANSRDAAIQGSPFSTGGVCQVTTGLEGVAPSIACSVVSAVAPSGDELGQASQALHTQVPLPRPNSKRSAKTNAQRLTIEHAIHAYLQTHHKAGHCPKTLEWHQTALRQFQQYLLAECHLLYVSQITPANVHDWIAFLCQAPTTRGSPRTVSTIETYARSVRAFCAWLVHRGDLRCSPMSEEVFPRASVPLPPFVQPEAFVQLMERGFALATRDPGSGGLLHAIKPCSGSSLKPGLRFLNSVRCVWGMWTERWASFASGEKEGKSAGWLWDRYVWGLSSPIWISCMRKGEETVMIRFFIPKMVVR
nr:hypothetical protein [Dictyobacter kobayashii]